MKKVLQGCLILLLMTLITSAQVPGKWSAWIPMGGSIVGPPAVATMYPGSMDLYARFGDGKLWTRWWAAPHWSTWTPLDDGLEGSPAASAWNGRKDVFFRNSAGTLMQKTWVGGLWQSAVDTKVRVASDPSATSWGPNRIDIVTRHPTLETDILHLWSTGGKFSSERIPGIINSDPVIVSMHMPDRLDVFARSTGNTLIHKFFLNGKWSEWEDLGGGLTSAPGAASRGPGRIDVVVKGTDNALWHKFWEIKKNAWSPWEKLDGQLKSAPRATSWVQHDRLDVIAEGADGQVWQRFWDATPPAEDVFRWPFRPWWPEGTTMPTTKPVAPVCHAFPEPQAQC